MRIKRITTRLVEVDVGGKVWNPRTRWARKPMLLVFAESDDGKVGAGEAWLTGATPAPVKAAIEEDIAPRLVGLDPFDAPRVGEAIFRATELSNRGGLYGAAWGAVDAAVLDLQGKLLGLCVAQLLGRHQSKVFAYASAGLYGQGKTEQDLADEVSAWVERGFKAVKIKVGGAELEEDIRRVAAVREAVGPRVQLMVDALYNLDVAQAIRMARAFEPFDIHFLEAPVSPYDVEGQARVARASAIPICGNENQAWVPYFRDLIAARAVHFVQFDIAACGGIQEGRRIGELARAHHLPCTLHASSTSVLFAGTIQLAAALPNCVSVEYHMLHQWLWEKAPAGFFEPVDGYLVPSSAPGIGFTLTPDDL